MNILIIEDDKLSLFSLKHVMESWGHSVEVCENAEEGMNRINEGKFDLVFCDIMMPGISGLSLLSILRTVHLVKTPVIAMSVLNDQSLKDAAFQAGANDFLHKPFSTESLAEKIKKFEHGVPADGEKKR